MPALLDDPSAPTIYRVSGAQPFPSPTDRSLPPTVRPHSVTLRDRQSTATIVPFASQATVPVSLLSHLADQMNREIDAGDSYPMVDHFTDESWTRYWFQNFAAIMLLGDVDPASLRPDTERDWASECLGTFYIKPNYPGRSSHVCNAGFIVTDAARNRGAGRRMGEAYLDWAPRLGYTYSVFNLVYETNVASCRIWDGLGFKRIGRVKGCGNLKSYPGRLVDAIIYGRELSAPLDDGDGGASANEADGVGADGTANGSVSGSGAVVRGSIEADGELVSDERFDKIRYYLKTGRYPTGADRAEKSRLRSAATHYKLVPADDHVEVGGAAAGGGGGGGGAGNEGGERLMLKGKEVISDPVAQAETVKTVHVRIQHGGINKTTATVAEKYHWSRIKDTVSEVIQACADCSPEAKKAAAGGAGSAGRRIPRGHGNAFLSSTAPGVSTKSSPTPPPPPSSSNIPPDVQPNVQSQSQAVFGTHHLPLPLPLSTSTTPLPLPLPLSLPFSASGSIVDAAAAAAAAAAGSSPVTASSPFRARPMLSAHIPMPQPQPPTPSSTSPSSRMALSLPSQHLLSTSSSPYAVVIQPGGPISPLSVFTPSRGTLSPSSPGDSPHHHHNHHHHHHHQPSMQLHHTTHTHSHPPQFSPHPHSPDPLQHHHHHNQHGPFHPIDPQIMNHHPQHHHHHQEHHHPVADSSFDASYSNDDFQALIDATMIADTVEQRPEEDGAVAVDADLDMFIGPDDDDGGGDGDGRHLAAAHAWRFDDGGISALGGVP